METGLADKVVLVTGASGGIGRAVAEVFADEGARLILHGNSHHDELARYVELRPWRDSAITVAADVANADEVAKAFAKGVERFGRIDVCVANAGQWPAANEPLHIMPTERFERTVAINFLGAAYTARAFMQSLAATGPRDDGDGASLVFTGSTAARFGEKDHCDYAAAKAALVGLVRSLKNEIVEIDPYARVNMVQPGWTATHMARPALDDPAQVKRAVRTMPVRQIGRAVDMARAIAFLASPRLSRHVSGELLTVAGGMEGRQLWTDDQLDFADIHRRLSSSDPG